MNDGQSGTGKSLTQKIRRPRSGRSELLLFLPLFLFFLPFLLFEVLFLLPLLLFPFLFLFREGQGQHGRGALGFLIKFRGAGDDKVVSPEYLDHIRILVSALVGGVVNSTAAASWPQRKTRWSTVVMVNRR